MTVRRHMLAFVLLSVALVAGACGGSPGGPSSPSPSAAPTSPDEALRNPADFVPVVDNPYFPLELGTEWVYEGESDGETERVEVTVTEDTKEILGIQATVVHDQVFVADELVEDTFDWYAQDRAGNVWYLGEDTSELENGEVVSHKGAWEAGVDGAEPGVIMLADPRAGDAYRQEFYAGTAEDAARVLELGASVEVPAGTYEDALVTEDFTALEPDILEQKTYAPGVGIVFEEDIEGGDEVLELVEIRHA
jgi:hypothetical protein